MQKIYSLARSLANAVIEEFEINQGFSKKECIWRPSLVEENFAIFEVHERVKNLLEDIYTSSKEASIMDFKQVQGELWAVEIRANGGESYFLARMLFAALARMKSTTVDMETINCEVIQIHTSVAASKILGGNDFGFIFKAEFEDNIYSILIPINGTRLTFADKNPDHLCRWIGKQLRGNLKEFLKKK